MAMDIKPDTKPDIGLDIPDKVKFEADKPKKAAKGKGAKGLIIFVIIIIILVAAGYLINQYTNISLFGTSTDQSRVSLDYNKDSYYAVFLSNGQVYFGKVSMDNDDYTVLEDIYYLQVSNPLQQVPPPGTEQQPQLTLVKLGNELHGPQDYMKINNQQIIFVEELRNDSRVVEAVMQYKIDNQPTE